MTPKLQKITQELERAKAKIAELQAAIPELERQKTELENAEIIKAFRTAELTPADFAAFIEAHRTQPAQAAHRAQPARKTNKKEERCDEQE